MIVLTLWTSLSEILGIFLFISNSYPGAISSSFFPSHTPKDHQGDHRENEHFVQVLLMSSIHPWHPLVARKAIYFSIITNLNLILDRVPEGRERNPEKQTKPKSCSSAITIRLVILSPTAAKGLPLANSQTTHLLPGLCCEASFFKHNKSSNFMSQAIVDFSLCMPIGMVYANKSPDLCYCR